jgi:lipoprotein-releasing system permease protein
MNLVSEDEMFFPEEAVVGGVFQMGQRDFDGGYIISSIGFARDLMGLVRGAYSLHLKTEAPLDAPRFNATVDKVGRALGLSYLVRTWREVDSDLFNALAVEKNMMMILNLFTTIVAMFCVTVTLIVATVQKRSEIGLLKALGFSSGQIMNTFLVYGWILCVTGTALGVATAYAILHNLQNLVEFLARLGVDVFPKSVYGLDQIPWRVLPSEVAGVAIAVVVFSTLAGIVPAWIAARKDPVEALRG